MKRKKIINKIIWGAVGLLFTWFVYTQFLRKPPAVIEIQKEAVTKETLFMEVSATGAINPIEMVDVGTQVSGKISEVMVDFNDEVKKGQVLARMDMRILKSSLLESRANLKKAQVVLDQTEKTLKRMKELFTEGVLAKVELEKAQDDFDNAQATFTISKLQLDKNSVNLGYADIISPINGVVISKNIEVGQTIAAAFTTPILFSIAKDLREMKIEASIDEADIGQVKQYQKVKFTVDTYPEEEFTGVVAQIQLQPTLIQNVVTYNVIILIQNQELKLMPGMTATLIIQTEERPNSISVPNSALSFNFTEEDWVHLKKKKYRIEGLEKEAKNSVWVLKDKVFKEIQVEAEFTNGIRTAIISELTPADSVITNFKVQVGGEEGRSLFMPRRKEGEKGYVRPHN